MMKDNMKHVCACMLGVVLLYVSTTAHAATPFFDENFEYADNTAWLSSGNWGASSCTAAQHTGIMEISSQRSFSGSKSLKMTYVGDLGATAFTCFIDRFFPASDTVYTRIYLFLDGFTASNINTKMYTQSHDKHYPRFWWSLHQSSNIMRVAIEGTTLGANANLPGGAFPSGRWACLETRVTLNTPGMADGIVQAWVDGVQRIDRTDLMMRNATEVLINGTLPNANYNGPSSRMQYTRMYRQHGNGVIYFDELAVGNTRIGCLGAQTDATPPAPPSNFAAN